MGAPVKQLGYEEAVSRLLKLGLEGRSLKWNLVSIRAMLEALERPDRQFPIVHIAGTNGKGSVAAMVASILRAAGKKTGLYTSPHLCRMNERINLDGAPIGDEEFAGLFAKVEDCFERLVADGALAHNPSYFETLTAMALQHFAAEGVDLAVLEVGLGGRLDATNAVTPAVCAITSIDFDHERWLGHSIEAIAAEKAGILKPGVPVGNAPEHPRALEVIDGRAKELGAPRLTPRETEGVAGKLTVGLRGRHQTRNARTALAIVEELKRQGWDIPAEALQQGLRDAHWPGRLQLVEPAGERAMPVYLDGAHNPAAARCLAEFWEEQWAGKRVHLIYGTLRDKAVEEIAELLFPRAATVILTEPVSSRATSVKTLAVFTEGMNDNTELIPTPEQALRRAAARATASDIILVAGSLYLVGDCLRALGQENPFAGPAGERN